MNFKKYKISSFIEYDFSVLEVIKIYDNKYGGIHFKKLKMNVNNFLID
ncbi:hypothetical protein SAMN05444377_101232 [Flavobacterium fontis]|uniref:Uncharacterized protein n=1 Tax=Flavobacterium fontis TaxID=1124188 RepID=A0A1M4WBA1_9FLAO|nr:hypothetical protein SAMN05444377_101232 [Flavobacterium fontis]